DARLLDQLVRNAGLRDCGVAQQPRRLQRHTDFVEGDDVRPQTGYLSADQRMPVTPALMILFQVERHDSELHRSCSVAPARPGYAAYDPTVPKKCLPRPRHPADPGFNYRSMGSSASCSPPARVSP